MQQPEAYIGGADKLFAAEGKLVNEGTRKFLSSFMQDFADWIASNIKSERYRTSITERTGEHVPPDERWDRESEREPEFVANIATE
jgi:hypothetical protein